MEIKLNNKKINIELDSFGNIYFNYNSNLYYPCIDNDKLHLEKYNSGSNIKINFKNHKKNIIKENIKYKSLKEKLINETNNLSCENDEDEFVIFNTKINFDIYKREPELPLYSVSIYDKNLFLIFNTYLVGANPIYNLYIFKDGKIILNYDLDKEIIYNIDDLL